MSNASEPLQQDLGDAQESPQRPLQLRRRLRPSADLSAVQPGQSGNPKGARNASSLAREALERPINVKVKGTSRKMTVRKAAYFRLAERAVAGDVKALDYLLALENEERPSSSDQPESERSAAKDLELLEDFFDRRRADRPQQKRHDHPQRRAGESERGNK